MALGWSRPRKDDDEPTTPSTPVIAVDMSVDPTSPVALVTAWNELEPVPYAPPDELQDDVIEPTAVLRKTGVIYYDVHIG